MVPVAAIFALTTAWSNFAHSFGVCIVIIKTTVATSPPPTFLGMNDSVVSKLTSARFLTAVMVVSTYCVAVIGVGLASAFKMLPTELFEKVFMGFGALASAVITAYFHRQDRPSPDVPPTPPTPVVAPTQSGAALPPIPAQ